MARVYAHFDGTTWSMRVPPLLVAVLCGAVLAGCSSASPAATPSTAHHGTTPTTAPASASSKALSCPPASAISSAMGVTYPAPQVTSGSGGTICNYLGSVTDVTITMSPDMTASEMSLLATRQGGVSSRVDVHNLGSLAILDTGTSGLSTELFVLSGSEGFEAQAVATSSELEQVARAVLAT